MCIRDSGMGAANNDPNAQELLQRVSRWTTHRILKFNPDFNIMSLKEPLEKYIEESEQYKYFKDLSKLAIDKYPKTILGSYFYQVKKTCR